MGHSHPDGAHTHGHGSTGLSALDQLAEVIAGLALAVVAVDVVMWLLHILVIIATAVGLLAIGTGAGYATVKWRQFQRRRLSRPPQYYPPQFYPPPPNGQFTSRSAEPALPSAGEVHLHLHSDDAAAVLKAIGQAGSGPR